MKIKPRLKKTLYVIGGIIASILFDIFSPIQVFSWIARQIKFFFTFSLPFKLWFCVLIVLLFIFVILFLFFIYKKLRLNSDSQKEPEQKTPDYVKEFTEMIFGPVLYKWNWIKTSNKKFPYIPDKIEFFCPKCNCELVKIQMSYQCSVCNCKYGVKDMNKVKVLIRHQVDNNLWKEENKK